VYSSVPLQDKVSIKEIIEDISNKVKFSLGTLCRPMGSGGIAPLFLTLAFDEVSCQRDVQVILPFRKVPALAVALESVISSDKVWKMLGGFAPACPARSLTGPNLGAGQPGSCPEHQPKTGSKTSLE
jgi:hypothetical protein